MTPETYERDVENVLASENLQERELVDTEQDTSLFGITWSRPISTRHVIKLFANTGVITRVGNDFDSFGVGWLYRF